jgi:hypothetical protein
MRPTWASACASDPMSSGRRREGTLTTATGRSSQPHCTSTRTTASITAGSSGASGVASAMSSRSLLPQPRSVRRARARPGRLTSPGFSFPFRGTPSLSIPEGHWPRGSSSTPTRLRAWLAESEASCATSSEYQGPAQLSQRPQGVAAGSSRDRERNSMRQPAVFS